MIEIVGLLLALGMVRRTAKRRGGRGWLWVVITLIGYFAVTFTATILLGEKLAHFYLLFSWAWVGMCLIASYFLTGGTKSAGMSWQCPRCRTFNDPSTLVCDCGQKYEPYSPIET